MLVHGCADLIGWEGELLFRDHSGGITSRFARIETTCWFPLLPMFPVLQGWDGSLEGLNGMVG